MIDFNRWQTTDLPDKEKKETTLSNMLGWALVWGIVSVFIWAVWYMLWYVAAVAVRDAWGL